MTDKLEKCASCFAYNITVGNALAVYRDILDTRTAECLDELKKLDFEGLLVSVVIPFHNELLSTVLCTILSVDRNSNRKLLLEIIAVNDFSDDNLHCLKWANHPWVGRVTMWVS